MSQSQRRSPHRTLHGTNGVAPSPARVARSLCEEAAAQTGALDLERWASLLLGHIWVRRHVTPDDAAAKQMLVAGTPVLEALADVGGPASKTALTALGRLDRGGLGHAASRLAAAIDEPLPDWIAEVGTASILGAFADCSPGDGEAFLLESQRVQGTAHMVAVFVDERLGGTAKHLQLIRHIDPMDFQRESKAPGGRSLGFRRVDPDLACRRVRKAIDLTDLTRQALVGESFASHRAIVIARLDQPGPLAA